MKQKGMQSLDCVSFYLNNVIILLKEKINMLKWLENAVLYEIYPTSFYDSNGDGIGDINGIAEKADYIKSLDVDAVWLNPIYKSPFKDGGYDVSDYLEIDKKFGTMDDLKNLIKVFKERGIKILLDLVVGHTSDKHKWFKKSACAKRNEYWDYYVWTDTIFRSYPGVIRGLYYRDGGYLPNYYASQPALNFGFAEEDPAHPWMIHYKDERLKPLREEFLNIMRYYFDMGIEGFRVDMASSVVKGGAAHFDENNPFDDSTEGLDGVIWWWNEVLTTLRKEYKDKLFIAEWVVPQRSIGMCGFDMDFLTHDTFAFNSLYRYEKGCNLGDSDYYVKGDNYFSPNGQGSLDKFVEYAEYLYSRVGDKGMFTTPTGTHDEVRMSTNKSPDLIKTIFAFMLTYKQVPFVYYGDEIGLEHNFNISKDGGGVRTGARTPMQWTEAKGRGFTTKKTAYLPTSDKVNQSVEAQENDENSILNTVRDLIKIRKTYPALNVSSEQKFIEKGYPAVYERTNGDQTVIILLNPADKKVKRNIKYSKVIKAQNAEICGEEILLEGQSFAILLK